MINRTILPPEPNRHYLSRGMILQTHFIHTEKYGRMYFDTLDDAITGAMNLRVLGVKNPAIQKNSDPINLEFDRSYY